MLTKSFMTLMNASSNTSHRKGSVNAIKENEGAAKTHLNRSQTLYLSCKTLYCKIRATSNTDVSFTDYKGPAD